MSTLKGIVKIRALSDQNMCLESSKLLSMKSQSFIQVLKIQERGLEGVLFVCFLAIWTSIPSCSMCDPVFLYYIQKDPLVG